MRRVWPVLGAVGVALLALAFVLDSKGDVDLNVTRPDSATATVDYGFPFRYAHASFREGELGRSPDGEWEVPTNFNPGEYETDVRVVAFAGDWVLWTLAGWALLAGGILLWRRFRPSREVAPA